MIRQDLTEFDQKGKCNERVIHININLRKEHARRRTTSEKALGCTNAWCFQERTRRLGPKD